VTNPNPAVASVLCFINVVSPNQHLTGDVLQTFLRRNSSPSQTEYEN
jgi:hypothetical protein